MELNCLRNIVTLSYDDKEDTNFLKVTRFLHRWRKTKNLYLILSEINLFKKNINIHIFVYEKLVQFLSLFIYKYQVDFFLIFWNSLWCIEFLAKNDMKLNILFKNLIYDNCTIR